jgi:hypothetical protein
MKKFFMVHRHEIISAVGVTAICTWTGVLFILNNTDRLAWMNFPFQFVIAAVLCSALWLIVILAAFIPVFFTVRWSVPRALSVATILTFLVFSYEAFIDLLSSEFHLSGKDSRIIYLITVGGILIAAWRISRYEPARVTVSVSAGLLTIMAIGSLLPSLLARFEVFSATQQVALAKPDARESTAVLSNENVYYVILDAYGGKDALRKYVDYDISPFIQEMEGLGYISIGSARANYTVTYLSIAATLNMNYIVSEDSSKYVDRGHFYPATLRQSKLPALITKIGASGYNFIHVGNGWAPCRANLYIACLNNDTDSSTFYDVFDRYLAPTRLIPNIRRSIFPSLVHDADALRPLSGAIEYIAVSNQPTFTFVHHLIPHEPLHSDCSLSNTEMSKDQYRNSIRCVNLAVLAFAQRIHELDPHSIVVIQADHGSGFDANWKGSLAGWSDSAIDERASILNLVRVPDSCRSWVRQDLSPINTMRLVEGCLERRTPDYLAEHTYLATYENSPDFGVVRDVTKVLREAKGGLQNPRANVLATE